MTACGRDFQRPPCLRLSAHVSQVGIADVRVNRRGQRWRELAVRCAQVVAHLDERACREDFCAAHEGCFGGVLSGQHEGAGERCIAIGRGGVARQRIRHRKRTANRPQIAGQ